MILTLRRVKCLMRILEMKKRRRTTMMKKAHR